MNKQERFRGFPSKTGFTPIPNPFFSDVLPQIQDLSELRVTLYAFWALCRKKGYPRFIALEEFQRDHALMSALKTKGPAEAELRRALKAATIRGTLLHLKLEKDGDISDLYLLNTEQDRKAVEKIQRGDITLEGIVRVDTPSLEERPNIFSLYEQHIGLLTPLIAEDLKEAEEKYPPSWIEDAFREAVRANKPSWRYVSRILERWAREGKKHGGTRADSKEDISPKEYIRKYGHLTKR